MSKKSSTFAPDFDNQPIFLEASKYAAMVE